MHRNLIGFQHGLFILCFCCLEIPVVTRFDVIVRRLKELPQGQLKTVVDAH